MTNSEVSCDINVLPDDCIDVVYDLKYGEVFVCGLMTKNNLVRLDQNSQLLGARISIENFPLLTNVPLHEIKNLKVDGPDIGMILENSLSQNFDEFDSVEKKLCTFGNSILELGNDANRNPDQLVNSIIELVRITKGKISLKRLGQEACIGIRQMQRRFKQRVGLTIKEFASIIRFNNAVRNIDQIPTGSLLDIAFESGFYDHAHMTNEFKRISGLNPSFFRECRFSTKRIII